MKEHDWEQLCQTHGPLVWNTVYRLLNNHSDALDCYQEVFLDLFRRTADQSVENWASLVTWLSVRRAIDALRQRKRETLKGSESVELVADYRSTDKAFELHELMERLATELAKLPDRQAESFWLRAVEQMSYLEIAELMGTDANEVGVLIHRARQSLRLSLSSLHPSSQE